MQKGRQKSPKTSKHYCYFNRHNSLLVIFGLCQNKLIFLGTLKILFFARFCKTLFLPQFLSNQFEILTQHS